MVSPPFTSSALGEVRLFLSRHTFLHVFSLSCGMRFSYPLQSTGVVNRTGSWITDVQRGENEKTDSLILAVWCYWNRFSLADKHCQCNYSKRNHPAEQMSASTKDVSTPQPPRASPSINAKGKESLFFLEVLCLSSEIFKAQYWVFVLLMLR